MKKSNVITFLYLAVWILAAIGLIFWRSISFEHGKMYVLGGTVRVNRDMLLAEFPKGHQSSLETTPEENLPAVTEEPVEYDREALFIGDSRTVGLWEYGGMEETDFFANVGMNVFSVQEESADVENVGNVTLEEVLSRTTYHKIHIMMGINELGYRMERILEEYGDLVAFVKEKQPNAVIFIEANLHVTQSRSEGDDVINNVKINQLNGDLSELAGRMGVFYIDANPVFDDAGGSLDAEKSHDNAHLYAKYYEEWAQWINQQMDAMISGG